jgi:hypothetical protein
MRLNAEPTKNPRPALGKVLASQFGRNHYRQYVEARQKHGAAHATINRELAIIRRGFTVGFQAEPQMVAQVPFIPVLEEDNTRQGFLEPEQHTGCSKRCPIA